MKTDVKLTFSAITHNPTTPSPWREPRYDTQINPLSQISLSAPTSSFPMDQNSIGDSSIQPLQNLQKNITQYIATTLREIKRYSGLTWEQLASIFQIEPEELYYRRNGKSVPSEDAQKVFQVLDFIKYIDRGFAELNRNLLQQPLPSSEPLFSLLSQNRFEEAKKLIEPGNVTRYQPPPLSEEAIRERRPPVSPIVLLGALQDNIAPNSGALIKSFPAIKPAHKKG